MIIERTICLILHRIIVKLYMTTDRIYAYPQLYTQQKFKVGSFFKAIFFELTDNKEPFYILTVVD